MLDSDPTGTHKKLVDQIIDWFKRDETLKKKIAEEIKIANLRTPKFYITPEIHKAGKPRRSVVSSINSPASKRWNFVLSPATNCNWNSILYTRHKKLSQ